MTRKLNSPDYPGMNVVALKPELDPQVKKPQPPTLGDQCRALVLTAFNDIRVRLLSRARRKVWNDEDALDVVQETYFAAFEKIGAYEEMALDGPVSFFGLNSAESDEEKKAREGNRRIEAFLWGVLHNKIVDTIRKKVREGKVFVQIDEPSADSPDPPDADLRISPEQPMAQAEHSQIIRILAGFIDTLPDKDQKVYELKYIEGLGHFDAAKAMGMTEEALRTRFSRLNTKIKAFMTDSGFAPDMT